MRTRYRFVYAKDGRYYWEAEIPGDSRVDQVHCSIEWF